ncbi:MAG: hypothetical protein KME21_23275 [Desmonostoc vinosum HA7617-LM4]|jgi:hypothetical protein|nr:hypothetical protein [Desmonostoc vinosum HA7617-LM4]
MAVKFLTQADGKGWTLVKRSRDNQQVQLPHYLKVNYLRMENNRDYFIPYESLDHKDTEFSVTRKSDGSSYLVDGQHLPSATVIFNPKTTHLWYGTGSYQVGPIWAVFTPNPDLPDGTYDLEIPDYPHVEFGDAYLAQTPYARCWFRIRKGGANTLDTRFLHTGSVSDGCVTVKDVPYWTKIYNYLFNHRKGDGLSVGTIIFNRYYD